MQRITALMMFVFVFGFGCGAPSSIAPMVPTPGHGVVEGTITDDRTGEQLANVQIEPPEEVTGYWVASATGHYGFDLSPGEHVLHFHYAAADRSYDAVSHTVVIVANRVIELPVALHRTR